MKIAYCGFDLFYECLEKIHQNNHQIMKIFTVKTDDEYEFSDKVTSFADKHNIEYTKNRITMEDVIKLEESGCDLLISAGYHYKIPISESENNPLKGINLHPALLPIGRGAWPMPLTILKGLDITGVTVHKLSKNFDEGDILNKLQFHVMKQDNLETLNQKYQEHGAKLLIDILNDFDYYWNNANPQEKGEYWKEPQNHDRTFTCADDIAEIETIIRAFWGFGSILKLPDQEIVVKFGTCIKEEHMHRFGKLVNTNSNGECFAINGGFLSINNE